MEDVFALGDCAGFIEQTGKQVLPALAQVRSLFPPQLHLSIYSLFLLTFGINTGFAIYPKNLFLQLCSKFQSSIYNDENVRIYITVFYMAALVCH